MLKQLIEKVIPKQVTVEEIHAEFDNGQQRILDECDKILAELNIPTETKIEKKAKMLEELGFVNSETVHQAKRFWEKNKEIEQKIAITSKQAETIRYFKNKYPFEKFITTDELDRICNKYNLIHAPVSNYIKDIPEKNVLEMKKCQRLEKFDKYDKEIFSASGFEYVSIQEQERNWFIKNIGLNTPTELIYCVYGGYRCKTPFGTVDLKSVTKVDKSGLFIAAPNSHFNLNGLDKKSKYGFFKVETFESKDPVVFEYCKDSIIRIISKWGCESDLAYLDPILQNETLN